MDDKLPVLVEVRRGDIIESQHHGAIVAADAFGHILARLGNADLLTSTRSTIKPIQAIPLITSGAADAYEITTRELAIACASHNGEPIHTEAASGILARAGLDESALMCGAHRPYSEQAAREIECRSGSFNQLHNNCSGKHAGMLLTAVHRGLATEDYVSPAHPVQQAILAVFTEVAGLDGEPPSAIDGCSAPTFGVPLKSLAAAFARLVSQQGLADGREGRTAEAMKRIVGAMIAHPEMIGGDGEFDTELMRAARGKLVAKIGAEAAYSVGVLPSDRYPRGLGLAIKIEDGAKRAINPAVVEALAQLEVLDEADLARLSKLGEFHRPVVKNYRKIPVGEMRPVFDLSE